MASYETTAELLGAISWALPHIMEGQITEDVKTAITQAVTSEVYMAYDSRLPPEVFRKKEGMVKTRRWHDGGLADPKTYEANYDVTTKELTVKIATPWHNIGFITTTGTGTGGNELADVIEQNGMYNAPRRPFIKKADQNVKTIQKQLEQTIVDYLDKTI